MSEVFSILLAITYLLVGVGFLVWIIFMTIDMIREWKKDDTK